MSLPKDTTPFQSLQISSSPSKSSPPPKPFLSTLPKNWQSSLSLSLSRSHSNTENYREWRRRTRLWYVRNLRTLIFLFFTCSFQLLLRFSVFSGVEFRFSVCFSVEYQLGFSSAKRHAYQGYERGLLLRVRNASELCIFFVVIIQLFRRSGCSCAVASD